MNRTLQGFLLFGVLEMVLPRVYFMACEIQGLSSDLREKENERERERERKRERAPPGGTAVGRGLGARPNPPYL